MRIVEIRDLDGPNLFLMSPAIKVEIGDVAEDSQADVISRVAGAVRDLHDAVGIDAPEITTMRMETPGSIVVAFSWSRRSFARKLGSGAAQIVTGERDDFDQIVNELRELIASSPDDEDAPMLVTASVDRAPIVSITGTNGKTTTSRLIDYVLRNAGYRVGLTSSAGVYIDNEQVLEGDYSGPGGARRVLVEPDVEIAVLETARGGLLLRGCGYDQADVAVITNVSEDHLGIQGIYTIDGLAEVKAIIAKNVKPGGFCVLNAENEHVLAMRDVTPGTPVLFSPSMENEALQAHIAIGGAAICVNADKQVVWFDDGRSQVVTALSDIPMTFNGLATHQVENALAAIAALVGLGIPMEQIREGLASFKSTAKNSKGRLNIFDVKGATVIIDFAHNEAGLAHLLRFGRNYVKDEGNLIAVVGTAGDRDNYSLRTIAQRAMRDADVVVLKDSIHYLRGREPGEMIAEMRAALKEVQRPGVEVMEANDERSATLMMLEKITPNDVLAVMCVEDYDFLLEALGKIGEEVA